MKNSSSSSTPAAPARDRVAVPRDRDLADPGKNREAMPSPDTVNIRDEEYPTAGKALPPRGEIRPRR